MKLSINTIKYLKSLHQRKFRQKYHNFIVEGAKMAVETLHNRSLLIEGIYALSGWVDENKELLAGFENKTHEITLDDLKRISLLSTPNQVLIVVKQHEYKNDPHEIANRLSLYLEDIQDPGNLGTILRIADWFGISNVFLSENCVEIYSPKVVQASMGAFLRVNCMECNLTDLLKLTPGLPVYGAVLDGMDIFKSDLTNRGLIVIGNESKGISNELERLLTHRISIPRFASGGAESLNAAVAAGILCAVFRNF